MRQLQDAGVSAMGPLPQEIRLVIHLGYAGHEGSERLQAGKEKLIGGAESMAADAG